MDHLNKKTNQLLRTENERAQHYLDIAGVIIIVLDAEGNITLFNKKGEEILGYNKRELLGKNWFDTCLPERMRQDVKAVFKQLISGKIKAVEFYENPIFNKKGEERIIAWHNSVIHNELGEITGILSCGEDITERRQAEDRAEHLHQVLRALRNVNQLITKEKDRGKLIKGFCDNLVETRGYFNAWIVLLDKSGKLITYAEAGLGKGFLPLIKRWKSGKTTACGKSALKTSDVVITENPQDTCPDCPLSSQYSGRGGLTMRLEYNGKIYGLASVSIQKKFIEDQEECSLFREVSEDIAFALYNLEIEKRRRQAEEALKNSEERFKILFEYAPDAYYLYDHKGNFLDGNKASERIVGYKKEELIGKSFLKLKLSTAKELARATKILAINIQGKSTGPDEFILNRKDGSRIPVEIMTHPVKIKNKTVVLGIARDITESKKAAEELKKHRDHLEELVKKRTVELEEKNKELERFNKLFVGREFRIKELRDRVKELEGKANR